MNSGMESEMISVRRCEDIDTLMRWREEVIFHVFGVTPDAALLEENRRYYESHVRSGRHVALIAYYGGRSAGCGSVCFSEELPSPDNPDGKCAYLMNIYVRDSFRSRGVGHAVVERLVSLARSAGCCKIYLETTEEGRSLYESLGFADLPDMMKLKVINDKYY